MKISDIKELIKLNKIDEAIKELSQILTNDPRLDEVIIQSAKKYNLDKSVRKGIIIREEANRERNQIIWSLLEICNDIKSYMEANDNDIIEQQDASISHLNLYPRGPMVEPHWVSRSIIEAFAKYFRQTEAHLIIQEANAKRLDADKNDSSVTVIKIINLPSPLAVSPMQFWTDTIMEACLNGPRMLAALLLTLPDDKISSRTQMDKYSLLQKIRLPDT